MFPIIAAVSVNSLVWVLLWIIVAAIVFYAGNWLIGYVRAGAPFDLILRVILAIIVFVILINAILTLAGRPFIAF